MYSSRIWRMGVGCMVEEREWIGCRLGYIGWRCTVGYGGLWVYGWAQRVWVGDGQLDIEGQGRGWTVG